tara:strand:- start:674 stop:1513 length:840 start_codon:yes stop_codon:yes gene_type:complete
MNWTIKHKMIAIGTVAALSLAAQAGLSWYFGQSIAGKVAEAENAAQQLEYVNDMKAANLEMVLMAMDWIIDKAEGQIQPERVEIIANNARILRETGGVLLSEVGENDKATVQSILEKIDPLAKGIQVDLKALIESNASQEEFSKIDDVIDEFGEGMTDALSAFAATLKERFKLAVEEEHNELTLSGVVSLVAFVACQIVLAIMLLSVGRGIVNAVGGMTTAMRLLADGDKTVDIPSTDAKDEIGDMAQAVLVFKSNMIRNDELAEEREKNKPNGRNVRR